MGWSCGTPKLEGQVGGWGWCLSWRSPHLGRAYLWALGEGEAHLQWGHWVTKLFQSRGHERGVCTSHLALWLRGHSWIQQALCEPLPWDGLAPSVNSTSCFTQAGSLLLTMSGLSCGPYEIGVCWDTPTACSSAPQPCSHSLGKASGSACPPSSSSKGLSGQWLLLGRFLLQSPWPLVG